MQVRFGKRKRIRFSDRTHPVAGIVSTIIGVVSLSVLVVLCVVSEKARGNAGIEVGAVGILSLIASTVGFVIATRCYRKEDIYMTMPTIGSILNGVLVIVYLLLFFVGVM